MHPRLTVILAEQHIADLHRAADHRRLVHTATTAKPQRRPTDVRPVAATPVSFLRRLRRRLPHTQHGRPKPREVQARACK
jgi:hypothetical protein